MVMPLIHCCSHDSSLVHFVHFPFAWNYDRIVYEHDVICFARNLGLRVFYRCGLLAQVFIASDLCCPRKKHG